MATVLQRMRKPRAQRTDIYAQATDEQLASVIQGLAPYVVHPWESIIEPDASDNVLLLLSGGHGGFTITKQGTHIVAQPGAVVQRRAAVEIADGHIAVIRGVHFLCPGSGSDNADPLVSISATSRVRFVGCTFERLPLAAGNYVSILAGGRASFVACDFLGVQTAGAVVNNAGIAANVIVQGGFNLTSRAHVAVTTISELT